MLQSKTVYDIKTFKRCVAGSETWKGANAIIQKVLFQRYHVLSLLGSGSSSSVYLAEHMKLNQYRAIKCIPKTQTRNASHELEVSLLKNLRHPGIPMIYDVEEDEEYFYIIEEFVRGESLSAFVQSHDNISQETIISVGIQLCEVLAYLHGQKPKPVLYLDLKPEHIILCGNQLKLIDFGIAAILQKEGNPFHSCGTRGFAAPEQYMGCGIDTQTDVFGYGVPVYTVNRYFEEIDDSFNDGSHIVYVNGSYKGEDAIGKLMHDFGCKESKDIYYPELAKGVKHFKEEEGGRKIMCEAVEKYAQSYAEKYAESYAERKRIEAEKKLKGEG